MRRIFTTLFFCCLMAVLVNAQPVTLTFTGRDVNNQYLPLSRVVVNNLTRGWQETLTWPDTVLTMTATGVEDYSRCKGLALSPNSPNPFDGITFANLQVTDPGDVEVVVTDITGRVVGADHCSILQPSNHQVSVTLSSAGIYFLTARQNGNTVTVKMVNRGNGGGNVVTLSGIVGTNNDLPVAQLKGAPKGNSSNPFAFGDEMEYVGYTMQNGVEAMSVHVTQAQSASQTVTLTFGDGLLCPGMPTVTDADGNVYNTVKIGDQCWMRENLRVTQFSDGTAIIADSTLSYTEPHYCDYSASGIPLSERGYLYNWSAAMHSAASSNTVPSGVQGVCPLGWHLPSDAEWTQLSDYVSNQAAYTCGDVANNIAKALASTMWWGSYSGDCIPADQTVNVNNSLCFGAVPAGNCKEEFGHVGEQGSFWSSTEHTSGITAYVRAVGYRTAYLFSGHINKDYYYSVRCLRD